MLPRPRKRFGQHFLTDRHYIDRIVAAIHPDIHDTLVEIGPGTGALTDPLAQRVNHLHVIELDRDLAADLAKRFKPARLTVHSADALAFDFATLPAPLRIVGNLPYNISTPLLFHIAEFTERIADCTFMLQREVVERMVAEPSTAAYGRLSVMLQYRFEMRRLFIVPPGAFFPPPKVDSAIVHMIPLGKQRARASDDKLFAEIVMAAFGQRRKTLRNTLKGYLSEQDWASLGIDSGQRAENLGLSQFIAIANYVVSRAG